jgi:hypothetical protein
MRYDSLFQRSYLSTDNDGQIFQHTSCKSHSVCFLQFLLLCIQDIDQRDSHLLKAQ